MVDEFRDWSQFDKQRKEWMHDKQPPNFSPYVRMYPPRLPHDYSVFNVDKERRVLVHKDGATEETLTHPRIVALKPWLPRVVTTKHPLHVIADEMARVWKLSVGQVRGYLLPWIIKTTPEVRERTWRNPTAEDVARIPMGPKGKTCRPNAVNNAKSMWMRVDDKKFKQFLDGKISWMDIQIAARGQGRIQRRQPILFPSHDGQRLPNGEHRNPARGAFVSSCAECKRKPRRYHNKLRNEYSMFCAKTEYMAGGKYELKTITQCSQSLLPHVFFDTHEEAIKHWNETQKELRGQNK